MSLSGPALREAVERERTVVAEQLRRERAERTAGIPDRSLVWLALAPLWTVHLADMCEFPTGGRSPSELFELLHQEGLCGRVVIEPELADDALSIGEPVIRYHMADTTRAQVLERHLGDPNRGAEWLRDELHEIGRRIVQAQAAGTPVSRPVTRWAELAAKASQPTEDARLLSSNVDRLLESDRSAEALRWIEAALPLETQLGGELTSAVARASRRLELFHRRRHDRQALERYQVRSDQVAAFRELLDGPDDQWALHYVGPAGLGKTMLMRYISTTVDPSRVACARIDFDYLNPDYPRQKPGLLLDQLAEELRLYAGEGADRQFGRFDVDVKRLHARREVSPVSRPRGAIWDYDLERVLKNFAAAVRGLPQPVLMLDTCEELAKLRPDGTVPANVQATFEMLERLHDRVPKIRVVFGGRRPLASSGAGGWQSANSKHPKRPYLRLHEMQGFPPDEAQRFLRSAGVRSELIVPILGKTAYSPEHSPYIWPDRRDQAVGGRRTKHYHPYDLKFYALWAREDPHLTATDLQDERANGYIELRIVRRLRQQHSDLDGLLPAVALLGRFDPATLRSVSTANDETFESIVEELANQEWIDRQPSQFLRVEPSLWQRLLEYCKQKRPGPLENARSRAADHLSSVTLKRRLSDLAITHFDSVVRLLEKEPERAQAWWAKVEARLADEGAWDWGLELTRYLLGDDGAAAKREPGGARAENRLRSSILLTHAGLQSKVESIAPDELFWLEFRTSLRRLPDTEATAMLRHRAQAAQLASEMVSGQPPADPKLLSSLEPGLRYLAAHPADEQLAGALLAAVESAVEHPQGQPSTAAISFAERLTKVSKSSKVAPELLTAAYTQAAKLAQQGSLGSTEGESCLSLHKLALQVPASNQPTKQRWLHWNAPDDVGARAQLEFIRSAYPALLGPEEVLSQVGRNTREPKNIDADRLSSAIISLRLMLTIIPARELEQLVKSVSLAPDDRPRCLAHELTPPLFATLAEAFASAGAIETALALVEERLKSAEAGQAFGTELAANRVKLRIARRMRLFDEGRSAASTLSSSPYSRDQGLVRAFYALGPNTRR
jgi:hypothetical protein